MTYTDLREDLLIAQDEFLAEINNTPEHWAAWIKKQQQWQASLKVNPLYVVSISRNGNVRYTAGAEFNSYDEAIAFINNNPTKLGIQAVSCLLPNN